MWRLAMAAPRALTRIPQLVFAVLDTVAITTMEHADITCCARMSGKEWMASLWNASAVHLAFASLATMVVSMRLLQSICACRLVVWVLSRKESTHRQ